ncbi:hypothetical protein NL50_11580 [Clostridium acetobutylicum]|nr:hypothetical protein NL50_11580 [Clostridium acetobutylicum]
MDNPFFENGFLCPNASINNLFIEKMPTDKVNENLQGKTAIEVFSTESFIKEIKKNANELNLDVDKIEEKILPKYLNDFLEYDYCLSKRIANNIVKLFGERLGVILLILKKGEKENRLKKKDWDQRHWDYWRDIKNVILAGGLSSSKLGENLRYHAYKVFENSNEDGYNIILSPNSSNIGIKGCSRYIKENNREEIYLVFDWGQTFIKRGLVTIGKDGTKEIINLNKVLSKHVLCSFKDVREEKKEAINLHKYLLSIIVRTLKEIQDKVKKVQDNIVISVANYVRNGTMANRGGYGKLRLLTNNYEKYLSCSLYRITKREFKIKLIHDGTAMAAEFSNYPNSVCISLGTVFGVGFPVLENTD